MNPVAERNFDAMCRQWRQFRKMSQLDLALAADVSQRHVSWLETGRSHPSREMVLRLSEAMRVPLRERNTLFLSAGFSPPYRETRLDEPGMAPVQDALQRMLDHHEPLPAIVVDRLWNVKQTNTAADRLLHFTTQAAAAAGYPQSGEPLNIAHLSLHPEGIRAFVTNWAQLAPSFVSRLKSEMSASADTALREGFTELIELAGPLPADDTAAPGLLPVLPLELDFNGQQLKLFSVISTFGTPQDITTDELRIESFYPMDEATQRFFAGLGEGPA